MQKRGGTGSLLDTLTGLLPVPCLTGVLPAHEDDVDAKDALAGAAQPDAGGL